MADLSCAGIALPALVQPAGWAREVFEHQAAASAGDGPVMRSGVLSAVLGALALTPLLAAAQGTSTNGLATEYGSQRVRPCCQHA